MRDGLEDELSDSELSGCSPKPLQASPPSSIEQPLASQAG